MRGVVTGLTANTALAAIFYGMGAVTAHSMATGAAMPLVAFAVSFILAAMIVWPFMFAYHYG